MNWLKVTKQTIEINRTSLTKSGLTCLGSTKLYCEQLVGRQESTFHSAMHCTETGWQKTVRMRPKINNICSTTELSQTKNTQP